MKLPVSLPVPHPSSPAKGGGFKMRLRSAGVKSRQRLDCVQLQRRLPVHIGDHAPRRVQVELLDLSDVAGKLRTVIA
jgi:hypothetical protein